jgi:hypothetical protein
MKRKFAGLALIAIVIISVSSGCMVREDDYYRHHYRHHDRYDRDRYDHDYYHGYHDRD